MGETNAIILNFESIYNVISNHIKISRSSKNKQ